MSHKIIYRPLEYTDLRQQAYERVKSLIISNKLKPREKIISFQHLNQYDEVRYMAMDHEFHKTIIQLSGNHLLKHLNMIGYVLIRTFPKGIILPIEESVNDHLKIIEAFKNRDGHKAEALLREHSYKARNILEKQLKNE